MYLFLTDNGIVMAYLLVVQFYRKKAHLISFVGRVVFLEVRFS